MLVKPEWDAISKDMKFLGISKCNKGKEIITEEKADHWDAEILGFHFWRCVGADWILTKVAYKYWSFVGMVGENHPEMAVDTITVVDLEVERNQCVTEGCPGVVIYPMKVCSTCTRNQENKQNILKNWRSDAIQDET